MPLVIGRNTLSYTGDVSEQQVQYHNPEAILIENGVELPLAPPISLSISDKCHHVRVQGNLNINVPYPDMPRVLIKVTSASGTQAWHTTVYDSSPNNATIDSSTSDPEPISEVQICLMSKAGQNFTLPANSKIHFAVRGCDAVLGASHAVTGPAAPAAAAPIVKGFRVPSSYSGIYPEIVGEYRFFPYSFDRTGADVTHVPGGSGIYERSEDDGSKVTVYILMHFKNDGWQTMVLYKREFTGGDYAAAKALHLAGTGHLDYSSRLNFDSQPLKNEWATPDPVSGHQYWFPFSSYNYPAYADGVGTIPEHTLPHDSTIVYPEIIQP